eukprot:646161-Hanusia_phi.AAC.2
MELFTGWDVVRPVGTLTNFQRRQERQLPPVKRGSVEACRLWGGEERGSEREQRGKGSESGDRGGG